MAEAAIHAVEKLNIPTPEAKNAKEIKPAWTEVKETLREGQVAGIFTKTATEWETDPKLAVDNAKKPDLAEALEARGKKAVESLAALDEFDQAVTSGAIVPDANGIVTRSTDRTIQAKIDKAASAYPDAIRGLHLIIAATDADPSSEALNKRAKRALTEIEHNISVIQRLKGNKKPFERSYRLWQDRLDKEAYRMWLGEKAEVDEKKPEAVSQLQKHRARYNESPALTKVAYQELAEREALIALEEVSYQLFYASEKPPEQIAMQEVQGNAIYIADELCKGITGLTIAQMQEAKEKGEKIEIPGDPSLSLLVSWRLKLADELQKLGGGDPNTIKMLTAEVTDAAEACQITHPELETDANLAKDPGFQQARSLLERNLHFFNQKDNNPAREFLQSRFTARGYRGDTENIHAGNVFHTMITLSSAAVEDRTDFDQRRASGEASRVSQLISRLAKEGFINGYEEGWLRYLDSFTTAKGSALIDERDHLARRFGITPEEMTVLFSFKEGGIFGLSNYLIVHVPQIAQTIYGHALVPEGAEEALKHRFKFLPSDINKKERVWWTMNRTIALLMALSFAQGILDFSGDEQTPGGGGGR